ncbi:pyridine nucleotide-disulfide oxidoreductase [Thalassospira xiamenensis]|nr:pyridine nucleotide-disulfide oxidoreductase [Thalassospira xiamenensis]
MLTFTTHPERPGRIVGGLDTGGVVLSVDGGKSWDVRGQGLPKAAVTAITTAATNPDTIYAAIRGDGLWQSDDAGQSWVFAMDRPWLANAERDLTALSSVDLATGMGGIWLYAGTDTGVTRVPDCFCRWQDVQPGDAMDALASGKQATPKVPLPEGEPVNALVSAVSRPATLYAALPSGIWQSQDAGVTWLKRSEVIATALAVHPLHADDLVIVNDDGVLQSPDGGRTWPAIANI